jgi:hypothetical protein
MNDRVKGYCRVIKLEAAYAKMFTWSIRACVWGGKCVNNYHQCRHITLPRLPLRKGFFVKNIITGKILNVKSKFQNIGNFFSFEGLWFEEKSPRKGWERKFRKPPRHE